MCDAGNPFDFAQRGLLPANFVSRNRLLHAWN